MPIFRLDRRPVFPPAGLAEPDGILAVGGDLSLERLTAAYRAGIFPWYDEPGGPILWWSPDPRLVLFPAELHVARRLERTLRQGRFEIRYDTAFEAVMRACAAAPRPGQDGTWITPEMIDAYVRLHRAGRAISAEAWRDGELVGGVYGVRMGRVFFGESMFHRERDASKVAFVSLVRKLAVEGVHLIDAQVSSEYVKGFGAREIPRAEFLRRLRSALI
jgi:leucyl/phenylalanyl-tRNA--protein transferase